MNPDIKKTLGVILGIFSLIIPILIPIDGLDFTGRIALGIFFIAAIFWISEPVPIWATSLLVIFCQVLLLSDKSPLWNFVEAPTNVMPYTSFYSTMAHPIIILFLGGFFLAAGAVKYGLDKSLTRILLLGFGSKPSNVILGLMVSTGVLSAFMSNTATTAMMITVVVPIIAGLKGNDNLRISIVLAIPCAANIGGIATPIGSPPNAVALGALAKQGVVISFSTWMLLATPLAIIMIFLTWRALLKLFPSNTQNLAIDMDKGWNTSRPAIITYIIFGLTVFLWVTDVFHGIPSTVVAFLPVVGMSIFGIIEKADLKHFSWDVLWLMAGGISLGISMKMGPASWLVSLVNWNLFSGTVIILLLGLTGYILSNLISNTVAATILIPICLSMGTEGAIEGGFHATLAAITVGIMVSFSMLLPISTPPNAIAMSTNLVETKDLKKIGLVVGSLGIVLTCLFGILYWTFLIPTL